MSDAKILVKGEEVDDNFRCIHYHSAVDIAAIKFKCCNTYFACYFCHQEKADHSPQIWSKAEFNRHAVACGNCKQEITIASYLSSDNKCPNCKALFNPRCSNHHHFYFSI